MSVIQKLFTAILPQSWAKSMETASRSWIVRCPCNFERSVWDLGGIRWKAAGNPRRYLKCPQCGQHSWHAVTYQPPTATSEASP